MFNLFPKLLFKVVQSFASNEPIDPGEEVEEEETREESVQEAERLINEAVKQVLRYLKIFTK